MPPNQTTTLKDFDHFDEAFWINNRDTIRNALESACEKFIVLSEGTYKIYASSLDWFMQEWGRDTFISLPGILLVRGKFGIAREIFLRWSTYEKKGLLPTTINEKEQYYDGDTSLWFAHALKKYYEYTKDKSLLLELRYALKGILYAYIYGTSYKENGEEKKIFVDDDGLVVLPPRATWMDASALGALPPITPREGKPIEVNALYYEFLNFLKWYEDTFSYDFNLNLKYYIRKVESVFEKKYWNPEIGYFNDVVDGNEDEMEKIRPNALFSFVYKDLVSLNKLKKSLEVVDEHLLTPGGLRTLSLYDKDYRGDYDTYAPVEIKDLAYHNGSAWPWLMGVYGDVLHRILPPEELRSRLRYVLAPLVDFLLQSPYGSLPELFSGSQPYLPGGTRSQAWSVGEVCRLIKEYCLLDD